LDDAMTRQNDRLYELLPSVHRLRDAQQGYPLRALLRVVGEQVDVVENDLRQLYDNWFIETAEDWVVPYLADLIGYLPVHDAGDLGDVSTREGRERNRVLVPRREVGNTLHFRRRKGTVALLEDLAQAIAGWPARAVEFYTLLAWSQNVNHVHFHRGRTVDVRDGDALDTTGGPFDRLGHTVDVRRTISRRTPGRFDIPSVGLFVWRLKTYSVTRTPAACLDESPNCYTFSVIGNDTALDNKPLPETDPAHIAGELNLPTPIRRRPFAEHPDRYYGERKSVQIWVGSPRRSIPLSQIVVTNLGGWHYRPKRGQVAVDPERGRIAFPPGHPPGSQIVTVSYRYAFSADIGGGEYRRPVLRPPQFRLYQVGEGAPFAHINDAVAQWQHDLAAVTRPDPATLNAVIEIVDSNLYEEQITIELQEGQTLQICAAVGARPVIGLSDSKRAFLDALSVSGAPGTRMTFDGLLVVGRSIQIGGTDPTVVLEGNEGEPPKTPPPATAPPANGEPPCGGDPHARPLRVVIRHCTLVPGWGLECDCEPRQPAQPSLELLNSRVHLTIEHSITGAIRVVEDEVKSDPIVIRLTDSILDATSTEREAIDAPGCPVAHAVLTARRSTIIGLIKVHAIELGENCIFLGKVIVARRQIGCLRFCYVPPRSRTPRRYHCEPDHAEAAGVEALTAAAVTAHLPPPTADAVREARNDARARVRPQFNSLRYGTSTYCQLALTCASEISAGADDESEMGVFHDLFQPQRTANLRARLAEYSPASTDAGIVFAS
jgi:hypothetical protein